MTAFFHSTIVVSLIRLEILFIIYVVYPKSEEFVGKRVFFMDFCDKVLVEQLPDG